MRIIPINHIKHALPKIRSKVLLPIAASAAILTGVTSCGSGNKSETTQSEQYDQSSYRDSVLNYNAAMSEIRAKEQRGEYSSPEEYLAAKAACTYGYQIKNTELDKLSEDVASRYNRAGYLPLNYKYTDPNNCDITAEWGADGNSQELQYYACKRLNIDEINDERKKFDYQERLKNELKEIPVLEDMNLDFLSKILAHHGFERVEFLRTNRGAYNVFLSNKLAKYDIQFGKVDNNSFAGIIVEIGSNKESEIYLFKAEQFETNKSNKFRLSKMRVVQDGLDADSPTKKKYEKQIQEISREISSLSGSAYGNISKKGSLDGYLSVKTIKDINNTITLLNPEGKTVSIYSMNKGALKLTEY